MVSKIMKKTPTKRNHRRHRKKSPGKSAATLIAAINKSILTCQRRLVKLFSKLAHIATPKITKTKTKTTATTTTATTAAKKGFKLLHKDPLQNDDVCRLLVFDNNHNQYHYHLPPLISHHKRTVFLDLDETLVHSKADPPPKRYDFIVRPRIDGELMTFYVTKRPGLDVFLNALSARFEVVVFTAGLREYASLVLDRIDTKRAVSFRLYRDSCREVDGKYVKDLAETGRDLDKVVIVDDNPNAYLLHPENAVPVKPFVDDMGDVELGKLIRFFEDCCDCFEDMRDAVNHFVNNSNLVGN